MKTKSFFFLLATVLLMVAGCSTGKPQILIAYYSQFGTTKALAEQIQAETGGDLFEIELTTPYPDDIHQTIDMVDIQRKENFRPELAGVVENIDEYDVVFLGTPIWFATAALPVFSFVEAHDLSGKTVVPFYTCSDGDAGTLVEDIKALCNGATVLESIGSNERERKAGTHIDKVTRYLEQLSF